jgi:hypothetical protein
MVGMVVTISPSFSLYRMVVFPAASKPTMRMRISFFPHSLSKSFENVRPMIAVGMCCAGVVGVWLGGVETLEPAALAVSTASSKKSLRGRHRREHRSVSVALGATLLCA